MSTVRIQLRRGLAADWTSVDPALAAGEIGLESDTNLFKIGTDGIETWTELSYANVTSSGLADSLGDYILAADRGQANGVASLDGSGYIPTSQLPPLAKVTVSSVANQTARLALTAESGDIAIQTDTGVSYVLSASPASTNSNWKVIADPNITTDLNIGGDTLTLNANNTQGPNGSIVVKRDTDPDAILFWNESGGSWSVSDDGGATNNYLSTKAYAESLIDTHALVTANVHGIADTTLLATESYADGVAANAKSEAIADASAYADGLASNYDAAGTASAAVSNHSSDTTSVHGIADTAVLATNTSVASDISTHNSDTTGVHGIEDTALLATKVYADGKASDAESAAISAAAIAAGSAIANAISDHSADTTSVHGISDTAELATKTYADSAVSTHSSDTTSVHGIADTSVLATATDIQSAKDYADDQIDAHILVTTNVHGITDTSKIVLMDALSTTLDGDLVVDGDLTINGTNFSASATSITIEDNLLQLAHENAANTVDLGLVVGYNDGAVKHAGIVRDVSDSKWKLFKDVSTEPSTVVAFGEGSLDDLALNNLTASGVIFADGTQTKEGVASRTPIVQKTNSYTLSSLTERDSLIEVSSSSATTITIPADATIGYPIGTSIDILQTSTGQVTIAGAGGVTVNATPGLKLRTQWSSATLFKRAENTWVVYGDLTA